jgi:SAM-dependent methyltransferase
MREELIYNYEGVEYPEFLKSGNSARFVIPVAKEFCKGYGLDVGCGEWPMQGALPIDIKMGDDAMKLPYGKFDYIFSSHCLEHLTDPVSALEHWGTRLKSGGVLFLYLPHPSMTYWQPTRNRKHLHSWHPYQVAEMLRELGFEHVIHSERDMAWSFTVIGFKK